MRIKDEGYYNIIWFAIDVVGNVIVAQSLESEIPEFVKCDAEKTMTISEKLYCPRAIDREGKNLIDKESLKKFCDDKKLKGVEVSAKLGTNVSEAFECLAKMIIADKSKEEIIKTYTEGGRERGLSIKNKEQKNKQEKKKCC